jgi:hypothetical protein
MHRRRAALTPEKRRLLSRLVQQRQRSAGAGSGAIPRLDRGGPLPLSFGQERLWFLDQLAPGNPFYNDCEAFRLRGPLDADALERALGRIVERHEILRTAFPTVEGRPLQRIEPALRLVLSRSDVGHLEGAARRAAVVEIAVADLDRPFALERLPLHRFHLVRLAPEEHVLLFTLHHIIFDGWSLGVFVRELGAFYEAESTGAAPDLPPLPIQYVDFAAWQRQRMSGERLERHLPYWRDRLTGPTPRLDLPTDRPRPAEPTFRGRLCPVELGEELATAVRHLGQREGVTPFVVLLAAYKTLLLALSGQSDLVVGTPIANRNHSETEPLMGFLLNTLALRTDLGGDPSFRELLRRVAETATGASENQELPFERLVAELNPERQVSYNPLFQVWFTLLSAPMPRLELHGLELEFADIETRTARFDLALIIWQEGEGLRGHFEYSQDLFDASTVERYAKHYRTIVDRAIQRPEAPLSELRALLEARDREREAADRERRRRAQTRRLSELHRRRTGG